MMVSKNIAELSEQHNLSKDFFEIITNKQLVISSINNIKANRDIHIELTQFIYNTDFYARLEKKLATKRKELASKNDLQERIAINEVILKIEEEVKHYKTDILNTAVLLLEVNETSNLILAKDHFFRGELAAANAIFNTIELETTKEKLSKQLLIQKKLDEIYVKLVDNAFEFLVKAQLTSLNLDITEAEDRFQKAIEFFEKGLISVEKSKQQENEARYRFEYGNFLKKNNEIQKSITEYKIALEKYKKLNLEFPTIPLFIVQEANILNNLGIMLFRLKDFLKSEDYFKQAININKELLKRDIEHEELYTLYLAENLNNLANMQFTRKAYTKAITAYEDALKIFKNLAKNNPYQYAWNIATTLNNIASLYRDEHLYTKAENYYQEALVVCENDIKKDTNKYLPTFAQILGNLGDINYRKKEFLISETFYKKALKYKRELCNIHPRIHLPGLAYTLQQLGNLQVDNNKHLEAEKNLKEAIKIKRKLALIHPEVYSLSISYCLNKIGMIEYFKNDYEQAEEIFKEAVTLIKTSPSLSLEANTSALASTYNNLGILTSTNKKYEEAEEYFTQALNYYHIIENKNTYLPETAQVLNNLGRVKFNQNNFEEAKVFYYKTLKTRKELAVKHPNIYIPQIAETQGNLGELYSFSNDYENAELFYLKALKIREKLVAKKPRAFIIHLIVSQLDLGIFYLERKPDREKSLNMIEQVFINVIPFQHIPFIQSYIKQASLVLEKWNIDSKAYFQKINNKYQKRS